MPNESLVLESTRCPQTALFFLALSERPFESFHVSNVWGDGQELCIAAKQHLFIYHHVIGAINVGEESSVFVPLLSVVLHSQLSAFWEEPFQILFGSLSKLYNRFDVAIAPLSLELCAFVLSALWGVDADEANLLKRFINSDRNGVSVYDVGDEGLL